VLKKPSKQGKKFTHTEPMKAESALKNCLRRLSLR
jgi:hypothetical protein